MPNPVAITEELSARSVEDTDELRTWLNDAEALVHSLPDRSADGSEGSNTHNAGPLSRVVERLHYLANQFVPEVADRYTLPGQPKHFSKAEVVRNLRLSAQACTIMRESYTLVGVTPEGICRAYPLPYQSPEAFRKGQLTDVLTVIEQWRADLVEKA